MYQEVGERLQRGESLPFIPNGEWLEDEVKESENGTNDDR
jgi:hypothetical protein